MPPIYSGSADEWCYIDTDDTGSSKSVEIIIGNFENHMKKDVDIAVKSHQFKVKDFLWHIEVKPAPKDEDVKGYVGIFLYNDNQKDLDVKLKAEIGGKECYEFDKKIEAKCNWGFPKIFTHKKCKDLLIDGKLKINLEMRVRKEEVTIIHGKGKSCQPFPDLSIVNLKIFEDKSCTDFSVICNGRSFPCHKIFLMASSPVFKAMIEGNMKEAKEGCVKFENCTEIVTDNFVKFFYTGQVDEEILKENAVSFLNLGEQYDIAGLKAITEQVMIANLDKENMLNFFQAAVLYKGKKIKAAAKIFLKQNRRSLVEQEGWKDAKKDPNLVLELCELFSME